MDRKRWLFVLLAVGLTLVFAFGGLGGDLARARAEGSLAGVLERAALVEHCSKTHSILIGDTLSKIGQQYGVSWPWLAEVNGIANPNLILAGNSLCVAIDGVTRPATQTTVTTTTRIPTISITSVVKDESVSIKTANYPANTSFEVLMGAFGTRGINGVKVTTLNSGNGGSFEEKIQIPDSMKGAARIAIRLQSTSSGHFSYNWFVNDASGTTSTGDGTTTTTPPSTTGLRTGTIPTFSIRSVVRDQSVTIRTANFPANDKFDVRMGAMGTRGVNGVKVETVDSSTGGSFSDTYEIPDSLKGASRIAIRLESPSSGYFSYNWFYNNSTSP